MSEPKLLHIYGQQWEHDDAYIIGNTEGLKLLRAAIDKALSISTGVGDFPDNDEPYCADGEGYGIIVMKWDEPILGRWQKLAAPYIEGAYSRPGEILPAMVLSELLCGVKDV